MKAKKIKEKYIEKYSEEVIELFIRILEFEQKFRKGTIDEKKISKILLERVDELVLQKNKIQ